MRRSVYRAVEPSEKAPYGEEFVRNEEAEPTDDDRCAMCGDPLPIFGSQTGFMVCMGSGGSMNEHKWCVDVDGRTIGPGESAYEAGRPGYPLQSS